MVVLGLLGLLLVTGLAVAVMASSRKPAPVATKKTVDSQTQDPQPATSTSVQLVNDSIGQDISSLNDDKDFPADKLSDKSLGL